MERKSLITSANVSESTAVATHLFDTEAVKNAHRAVPLSRLSNRGRRPLALAVMMLSAALAGGVAGSAGLEVFQRYFEARTPPAYAQMSAPDTIINKQSASLEPPSLPPPARDTTSKESPAVNPESPVTFKTERSARDEHVLSNEAVRPPSEGLIAENNRQRDRRNSSQGGLVAGSPASKANNLLSAKAEKKEAEPQREEKQTDLSSESRERQEAVAAPQTILPQETMKYDSVSSAAPPPPPAASSKKKVIQWP